jgi:hypothetical protein
MVHNHTINDHGFHWHMHSKSWQSHSSAMVLYSNRNNLSGSRDYASGYICDIPEELFGAFIFKRQVDVEGESGWPVQVSESGHIDHLRHNTLTVPLPLA